VTVRRIQLDVSLSGPLPAIQGLSKEKFKIWIEGREVHDFDMDLSCFAPPIPAEPSPGAPARTGEDFSIVFFFDLLQMTTAGRQRSVELSRELVGRLIQNGVRAMILASSGKGLSVVEEMTSDPRRLLAGLDRIAVLEVGLPPLPDQESEREEALRREASEANSDWQIQARQTARQIFKKGERITPEKLERFSQIMGGATRVTLEQLAARAATYQREEADRARQSFERLAWSLGLLSGGSGRKVVLYFADTLRRAPGEHYFRTLREVAPVFAESASRVEPRWSGNSGQPFGFDALLDLAVNGASWRGVRFYTIEAEGLAGGSSRVRDAQNTLSALALETGGRAFLNGVEAPAIAEGIVEDLRCVAFLTLDPEGFPEDRPLSVRVVVRDREVRSHTRGRVVVPSEKTQSAAAIVSASLSARTEEPSARLLASLIPVGSEGGRLRLLAQVATEGFEGGGGWQLGGTVISRGEPEGSFSRRIEQLPAGGFVVIEKEVTVGPGPFELVTVGREDGAHEVLSRWVEGAWDGAVGDRVSVSPIALVQAAYGFFVREGGSKHGTGSLGLPEGVKLRSGVPTALIAVACAGPARKEKVRLLRRLVGEDASEFPVVVLDEGGERGRDRCVQVRDTVPGGVLGAGYYRYEIEAVGEEGEILARAERVFEVEEAGSGRNEAGGR